MALSAVVPLCCQPCQLAAEPAVVMNQRNIRRICRILGSDSGGDEQFYFLGYNTM
jgi:hypothetical protein